MSLPDAFGGKYIMAEAQADRTWLRPFLKPLRPIFYEMLTMSVFINLIALVVPIFKIGRAHV